MCEGSASIAVDRDGVEGACGGREVLPVGLLTRPRSDRSRSCERVTGSLRTSHPGQQGKVASIGGVGTTIGTSVGRSGMACSGTLGSA